MTAIVRGMNTIRVAFTILGEVPSMKNSREIVKIGGMSRLIKSAKAREYERSALLQIPHDARLQLECRVRGTVKLIHASERPDADAEFLWDILATKYRKQKGVMVKVGDGEYGYAEGKRVVVSKGVYINDRQVREKHVYHAIDRANPRAEIVIEPMDMVQAPLLIEPADESPEESAEVPF